MKLIACLLFCLISTFRTEALPRPPLKLQLAIVNGEIASPKEARYIVQIRQFVQQTLWTVSMTFCGGSFISNQTVLTAAHCVQRKTATTIRYGSNQLNSSPNPDIEVNLNSIHIHPEYNPATAANDIAIINLHSPISSSDSVHFVPVRTTSLPVGAHAQVFGWGITSGLFQGQPDTLLKGNTTILSEFDCYSYTGKSKKYCGRSNTQSVCSGDSGGPIISPDGRLAGIVSQSTRGCPIGGLNVFTDVSGYLDFIKMYTL